MPFLLLAGLILSREAGEVVISQARQDAEGFLAHTVKSPYQSKETLLRVLLPEKFGKESRLPVVYVLPVEAGSETRYGDGLLEVKKQNLHNKYGVVFVAPTFTHLPWYADHPTNMGIRQESYLLKVVVPFIEKTYPVHAKVQGRLLLGFSKSGYGALSLLLRHPQIFGKACAWDAPLMLDTPGKYGSGDIYADAENFAAYRVSKLFETQGPKLGSENRIILLGYGNFRTEHQQAHTLLEKLKVPHEYRDGPNRKHEWQSGWVAEAVELLLSSPMK